ncbi:hypothetical protein BDU57DRAFT_369026 [Ampelomyces quisqualis]|uniref:Uncharacterized protein n=1 Tax=Ampelomyces quisqualis TaxID=50730 RepID=A0A6A5QEA8_AMPQU|nr:hypothetical protein BDU57DRAFT_369026 [Ampelomyces quisqualis]
MTSAWQWVLGLANRLALQVFNTLVWTTQASLILPVVLLRKDMSTMLLRHKLLTDPQSKHSRDMRASTSEADYIEWLRLVNSTGDGIALRLAVSPTLLGHPAEVEKASTYSGPGQQPLDNPIG